MKITILTTITNPEKRQDKWLEALNSYCDIADEVVCVNGGESMKVELGSNNVMSLYYGKVQFVDLEWPFEWNWFELPKHLNFGLEKCTGDWIIKMDIDQFFHEKDKKKIREELKIANSNRYPVATFSKFTVFSPYKMFQKGQIPIAINRNISKKICFGLDEKEHTDLCYPILQKGIKKVEDYLLPVGSLIKEQYSTGVRFYNYDYFFKDLELALDEFDRFSRAYNRYYKTNAFNSETFLALRVSYNKKTSYKLALEDHPIYIRDEIKRIIDNKIKVVGNLNV